VHQVTRCDNGLTIATAAMPHMASVSVGLWVGVGGRHETASLNGVAHFIEHMLFKGTRRRTAEQISQDVEGVGGYLNAFTSEEHTCFYSKALHHRLDDLVDVLFDMLLNSRFAPDDIRREREVIREEVAMYLDQPQQHVQELFNEAMWPGHALGRPLTGTFASITRIGRPELLGFLETNYTAPAVVVAAAGALRHQDVVAAVRRRIRRLPRAPRPRSEPFPPGRNAAPVRLFRKKTEQSQIALGFRTCSRHDPRRFAVRLLNIILGENMSSRLFQIVREDRGLAYSIYSTPSFWDDVGDLVISVGLDAEKIEPVLRLVGRELLRLTTRRVSREELRRAKDYALGQIDLSLENTENHMMWLGEQLVSSGRLLSAQVAKDQLARITAAAIQGAARDFLRPERRALAVVSPLRSDQTLRRGLAF
jgi:predicted Zn-dependent peptidase